VTHPRTTVALMAVAHDPTHDPVVDFERCWLCRQALNEAWVKLAPEFRDADVVEIIRRLRGALLELG